MCLTSKTISSLRAGTMSVMFPSVFPAPDIMTSTW